MIAALAALALCLTPAGAGATDARQAPSGFSLASSNGYEVSVYARQPTVGTPSEVILVASREDSSALYIAAGKVTPTSFEGDFGTLGRVAVTFRATGGAETIASDCDGAFSYPKGVYEGTIEFHGEGGYTDVAATSVPGQANGGTCGIVSESVGPRTVGAKLSATSGLGETGFFFSAHRNGPRKQASFMAEEFEPSGDVAVVRIVRLRGPPSSFTFTKSLSRAEASPPPPFSGSGTFTRGAPLRRRWSGNLAVDFPGRPDYPLTGPSVRSFLQRASVTEKISGP